MDGNIGKYLDPRVTEKANTHAIQAMIEEIRQQLIQSDTRSHQLPVPVILAVRRQ